MSIRIAVIGLLAISLILSGCSGSGSSVSTQDAEIAYVVGVSSVLMASLGAAFGEDPEGFSQSEDGNTLTFDGFDISEFGENVGYTEVSGTAARDGELMKCDLKLVGGPVKTIEFEISDLSEMTGIKTTVKANGKDIEIEITEDTLKLMGGE